MKKNISGNNKVGWFNVTNMLVIIAIAANAIVWTQLSNLDDKISDMNNKIFIHMTNADIHIPREMMLSRGEFIIYQNMSDQQIQDIKNVICEVREILHRHFENQLK